MKGFNYFLVCGLVMHIFHYKRSMLIVLRKLCLIFGKLDKILNQSSIDIFFSKFNPLIIKTVQCCPFILFIENLVKNS